MENNGLHNQRTSVIEIVSMITTHGGKQTMKNYNDNPLDFNTNPDPYWNAKPLYGKPDLQALYA